MSELKYWLWLTTRQGLGPAGALAVLDCFVTPERAYFAGQEDMELLPLPSQVKRSLLDKSMDRPDQILADCDRLGLRVMTFQDADYPQRLRQIADPPAVLYVRGRVLRFDEEAAIGVVGTRKCSVQGARQAERFGMELASAGALVVSGIAQGIDASGLRGALKGGGAVACVLAGGVDVKYPHENRFLYDDVAAAGALISEYPPGTAHKGSHFKPRNRILSGLCLGVLAVECGTWGGTMLTVDHALEQGREVYAVPTGLDEGRASGTNRLIYERKARLVERAEDILRDFTDLYPLKLAALAPLSPEVVRARMAPEDKPPQPPAGQAGKPRPEEPQAPPEGRERIPRSRQRSRFTDDELAILAAAAKTALTADELVEKTQLPARYVMSALTMLQVQGAVTERPGRRFYAAVELEE